MNLEEMKVKVRFDAESFLRDLKRYLGHIVQAETDRFVEQHIHEYIQVEDKK